MKRTIRVTFLCTPEEKDTLLLVAESMARTLSDAIRVLILEKMATLEEVEDVKPTP